ncbi:hypothetical protein SAMN02745194_01796 [Roseomonas rosea]|jgi:hypothetical protein|uniref:Uncharacterized protein n=1 Tax=Muricoccus roseus TaxID=198092 RepID=A0A1M6GTK0_9PROT|nr:hypothetical protein [Roseomonas rosea]SHJ13192.1 hypothetical protein SAMN02745194_01796 [Roseomonas rosea]
MAEDIPPGSARVLALRPILDPRNGTEVTLVSYETQLGRFYALLEPSGPHKSEIHRAARERTVVPMLLLSDG